MQKPKLRRLFWDIETSPNVVLSWRVGRKLTIDQDNILTERAIICIGWKWEGEKQAHCLTWDNTQSDRDMLAAFLAVAAEADELVAHNGDRFDMGWFRTRCLFHGFKTLPDYKTIDTLAWSKRLFLFNSNKLDYIARFLGLGCKIKTEFGLWKEVVFGATPAIRSAALARMVRYCKHDVFLLEKVWDKLRHAAPVKTNKAVFEGKAAWACPHCGGSHVRKSKTRVSGTGAVKHQMLCTSCDSYYTLGSPKFVAYTKDTTAAPAQK